MYIKPIEHQTYGVQQRHIPKNHTHKETIREIEDAIVIDSVENDGENQGNKQNPSPEEQAKQQLNKQEANPLNITA